MRVEELARIVWDASRRTRAAEPRIHPGPGRFASLASRLRFWFKVARLQSPHPRFRIQELSRCNDQGKDPDVSC